VTPSVEENVDVVRDGYDAINREGPDGARRYMDPDIELEMPEGLIDAGSYRGRDAVMRVWHAYFDEFDEFRGRSSGSSASRTGCSSESASAAAGGRAAPRSTGSAGGSTPCATGSSSAPSSAATRRPRSRPWA
jgi:ketosteroid isomerase-like protein